MAKMNTDFDFLTNLYKTNPTAFAEYHDEVIEEYIQSLPEEKQVKARQMQWNLKGELAKYKNPITRMNRMVELMWESFYELQDAMRALSESAKKAQK